MFVFLSLLAIQHTENFIVIFFFHSSNGFEENGSLSDPESDELNTGKHKEKCGSKSNKKQKKAGRKPRWSQELLNDFIDIIVSSDQYKKKLIFRNMKCQQNAEV